MRAFLVVREEDVSGVSGTGIVAEAVEFDNGKVAVAWLSSRGPHVSSIAIYESLGDAEAVHGHGGRTYFKPLSVEPHDPSQAVGSSHAGGH